MKAVFDQHKKDFKCDFTIEFDVKHPRVELTDSHIELMEAEWVCGGLTNLHSQLCFNEIMQSEYRFIDDWSFAGRSNGWWVLICKGDPSKIKPQTLNRIEKIVQKYFESYGKMLIENFDRETQLNCE